MALAHQGSPNFLSRIDRLTPAVDGVSVSVLNRDDRLLLQNTSGEDVLVKGYTEEPYARIDADGTAWVNTDSDAYYLNDERDGKVEVPPGRLEGRAALEGDLALRALRVARPPDALDVPGWTVEVARDEAADQVDNGHLHRRREAGHRRARSVP